MNNAPRSRPPRKPRTIAPRKPRRPFRPSPLIDNPPVPPLSDSLADKLGVAHVGGDYSLTKGDFLNEGADAILKMGSRVIKVWFTQGHNKHYPHGPRLKEYKTLVELAQTPSFRRFFDKPFSTFILETFALGRGDRYWQKGITPAQEADERKQFRELTAYLLKTYAGTGKTFILQNWEGDWAVRPRNDRKIVPPDSAYKGMIKWLNARQDGVEEARRAFFRDPDKTGVAVYHAAEVNLLVEAMRGEKTVTNNVLPHTHCDLYSYSAYDTAIQGTRFREALDYLASKAPNSKAFGAKNLYIGEFGVPQREFGADKVTASLQRTIRESLDWGIHYLVYWEIYDNECKEIPATREDQCRGWGLITPTGRRSLTYNLFEKLLKPSSASLDR